MVHAPFGWHGVSKIENRIETWKLLCLHGFIGEEDFAEELFSIVHGLHGDVKEKKAN